jgi:4-hydroxy-tetrahydrodipicolinate reductase
MVIGATGHSNTDLERITDAADKIAIVMASNFSRGIEVVRKQLAETAERLGDGYDVEIVETHHRHKIDAPSGTALMLADELLAARGGTRDAHMVCGRGAKNEARQAGEIGVHSIRMGGGISEHEIHFSCPGETVTIRHRVHSREPYALGALDAAAWVAGRPAGRYSMAEVVGTEV